MIYARKKIKIKQTIRGIFELEIVNILSLGFTCLKQCSIYIALFRQYNESCLLLTIKLTK